ncbi:MAG: 5-(carboxyamino)imidazole ribonucleotide synthase [Sphingomonas sp.]|jgi:5-(carboxyamino)imidazole ribonucleotide synthase
MTPLPPGSTIGIVGGGQLGRMLASAAAELGYRTLVLASQADSVAAQTASAFLCGNYHDEALLDRVAMACDVITYEFENIDAGPLEYLGGKVPVLPKPAALRIAQDRAKEKRFVEALGARAARWAPVSSLAELNAAITAIGAPAILKTATLGYDGKGQARIASPADTGAAWNAIAGAPAVLEAMVAFSHEFSIITVRGADGALASYPPPWNEHEDGVLARSSLPAPPEIAALWAEAAVLAARVAEQLDYVGVLTLEFFASADGPVFNEMAPRVHNSGHWTIEGAITSQFENHIRAICGLPLGDTGLTAPAISMQNLIGDDVMRWAEILAEPGAHLHLYGKELRAGRKMGHVTRLRCPI